MLQKLVTSHVRDFFLADNSVYMSEHLLIFRHLLAYLDPELAYHLHSVGKLRLQ
jgi:TBC domain-containing protein kinase-like protein